MQSTSQFRSVCLTEQRQGVKGQESIRAILLLWVVFFGRRAGSSPTMGPLRDGRNSETDENSVYKPYYVQDVTGRYEIIAAMWTVLTVLACVHVCVCVEGDAVFWKPSF